MRKYWKVICSVLATVMVLSVFTGIVLADDPYKYKAGDKFDIAYYEDEKLLNVKCYVESINLYQIEWPETPDITKVVFDVSNIEYEDKDFKGISLRGEVDYNQENSSFYSNVTSVEVVSSRTQILNYLEIYGFSGVGSDGITISDRLDINEMTFTNLKVDSLDFLKNYDFENVQFNNCKSLEVADMSAYPDVHFHFFSCKPQSIKQTAGWCLLHTSSCIITSHFLTPPSPAVTLSSLRCCSVELKKALLEHHSELYSYSLI